MFGATWTTRRILVRAAAFGTVVCAYLEPTAAQTVRPATPTSTFDQYHNARPLYRERRELHLFGNDTQRRILRGNQNRNRRVNRRGGTLPFSLGGNRRTAPASRLLSLRRRTGDTFSANRAGAFSRFENRGRNASPRGTAMAAMARRQGLLARSSRNATILGVLNRGGRRGLGIRPSLEETPFVQVDRPAPELGETETSLHDFYAAKADRDRERLQREAWEHFRRGEYLDAARLFGTATRMDPSNNVSRTGELLCDFIVQARQTSLAVFKELLRHDSDLFGHKLGGSDAQRAAPLFGNAGQVGRLQSLARSRIGPSESRKEVRAMHLLVLWYLGKTSEAQRGAEALAQDFPDSRYAAWPGKMSSEMARQQETTPDPG